MDTILNLHAAQPFWIWLAIGVALLAIEAATSTEWLLWPAVSAGVVAVLAAVGVRLGFGWEVAIFAGLTIVTTLLGRRFVVGANPDNPDVNDRAHRLVGQRAQVVQSFVGGRGRVFVSGAEWLAEIDGAAPAMGESVVVDSVDGSLLKVRAA